MHQEAFYKNNTCEVVTGRPDSVFIKISMNQESLADEAYSDKSQKVF